MQLALCLSSFMAIDSSVHAQDGTSTQSPAEAAHIRLALEGTWPPELAEDLTRDLRASLLERGIAMILGASSDAESLATVRIDASQLATSELRIVVEDALTRKIVERSMSLEGTPPDVWSVLAAAAADELLRASWIELSMPDAPAPTQEVPQVVEAAIAASVVPVPEAEGAWGIGADASLMASEGATFLGARLTLTQASLAPLTLTLGLGAAGLLPMSSARARIDAVWLFVDVEAGIALLPRTGDFRLSVVVGARGGALLARATALSASLQASDGLSAAILLDGGFRGALALIDHTHLTLGALVGAPVTGVVISDGAEDIVRFTGITVRVELGVEVWL